MPASINGCGTKYYGCRDEGIDGSYVTTEWLVIAYIPIIPIASFRVVPAGDDRTRIFYRSQSYRTVKIPFCWRQIRNVYLFTLAIPIALFFLFFFFSVNRIVGLVYLILIIYTIIDRQSSYRNYTNILDRNDRKSANFADRSRQEDIQHLSKK